jgi:hypothetical protein
MSRSNPSENGTPNPATRWFEWNGEHGVVRYYDKDTKKNVDVGSDFTFILLDQLGSVRGWHDASESGIYSNEVKDTRQEVLVVKAFKGGTLAEGIYKDIKDRVNAVGGQFVANCYIAYKGDGGLSIGSLRLKGAALGAWMEFTKAHRADLYKKAVRITGYTEGKKGRIVFRVPVLSMKDIAPATDAEAIGLDTVLQEFLKTYFARTKRDQVETPHQEPSIDEGGFYQEDQPAPVTADLSDDDIPFAWVVPFLLPALLALHHAATVLA